MRNDRRIPVCGQCSFFIYEDANGLGWCSIIEYVSRLDVQCTLSSCISTRDALKVVHHYQNWRRGKKIKQPHPYIIGIAIDQLVRYSREKLKSEE